MAERECARLHPHSFQPGEKESNKNGSNPMDGRLGRNNSLKPRVDCEKTRTQKGRSMALQVLVALLFSVTLTVKLRSSAQPPTLGFSHGVPDQNHCEAFMLCTCRSANETLLRPLCRNCGPPQFGSSLVTPP